jgi:protein involved in sex pheromone biosynthesis
MVIKNDIKRIIKKYFETFFGIINNSIYTYVKNTELGIRFNIQYNRLETTIDVLKFASSAFFPAIA